MTKTERQAILNHAERREPIPNFAQAAHECAEAIHERKTAIVTMHQATAFVVYQAMQLNGEWNEPALTEAFEFLRLAKVLNC